MVSRFKSLLSPQVKGVTGSMGCEVERRMSWFQHCASWCWESHSLKHALLSVKVEWIVELLLEPNKTNRVCVSEGVKKKTSFPFLNQSVKQTLAMKRTKTNRKLVQLWKQQESEKVDVNFLGLFLSPLHWSNLFWPAPFWLALLKQHLQGGPPASSLY